ncbi:DNA polymerase III subunit epsilon [Succinatimonas hippei]|uniref:DNA polymerase III subunit epsilon n=1 Tax=Succinatimonas hippei TaxID=626938 RepID=UPI0026ED54FB|nr:DNA polymerase III subunit epsilon [Succinatimonas hippei]
MALLRQVALDTETTGKSDDGTTGTHRIIEVGCVEIINRRLTGRQLQLFVNPDRHIDEEATEVHGITDEMLADKPHFAEVADELIDFIRGSELLIHNAKFDSAFLDKEWDLLKLNEHTKDMCKIVDTVELARKINPNNQVNLDNLCSIYDIDNSRRTVHGALLDAQLLAEVYLAMTGGQSSFDFGEESVNALSRHWERPKDIKLPLMHVETDRHAVHVAQMISLAQGTKISDDGNGNVLAGSYWSDDFSMPFLAKGKEEGKKDYAKRLAAQKEEMLNKLLSQKEREGYASYKAKDQALYDAWVARVMKTH